MNPGDDGPRATVPGALWRRRKLAVLIVAACTAAALVAGGARSQRFASTARIVVEDPDRSTDVLTATISPDRFVKEQLAVFELQTLSQLGADIVNDSLRAEDVKRAGGTAVIGSQGTVTLGLGGAVHVGAPGADLARDADGTVRSGPSAGVSISADGTVRRADGSQIIAADGRPIVVGERDLVGVRSDGLLTILRDSGPPVVVANGDSVDDLGRATIPGFSATPDAVRISYGQRTATLSVGGSVQLVEVDGSEIVTPDGDTVGDGASLVLLDSANDGTAVVTGDDSTVVVDSTGAVVVADESGAILDSTSDAVIRSEAPSSGLAGLHMNARDFANGLSVAAREGSNLIEVTFVASDPDLARIGANAAVDAYEKLRQSERSGADAAALSQADSTLTQLTLELVAAEQELNDMLRSTPARAELATQYDQILAALAAAGRDLLQDPGGATAAAQRITNLQRQLDSIRSVQAADLQRPEIAEVAGRRDRLRTRLEQVQTQRDSLLIDSQRSGSGVTIFSPATETFEASTFGTGHLLVGGFVAGLFAAALAAYLLESRSSRVENPDEIAQILGAPLLGEIPDYRHERIKGGVPVTTAPTSYAAEAYRFAAAAVVLDFERPAPSVIGIVSASVGDGKTSVAANLSLALAHGQRGVLVVDADLEGRMLSTVLGELIEDGRKTTGLSDILAGVSSFEECVDVVPVGGEGSLELLGAGASLQRARSLFDSDRASDLFAKSRDTFDVTLVDLPPMLAVAYGASVLRELDAAVVVVRRGSKLRDVHELRDRLRLIGRPVVGFVLTRTPLRVERRASIAAINNNGHDSRGSDRRRRGRARKAQPV